MDTLSTIRKVQRKIESLKRKDLKRRMDGYNGLASARRGGEGLGDQQSPDTLHDVSQRLTEQCQVRVSTSNTRSRFVRRQTSVDRALTHVVCNEVRQQWNERLHAHERFTDEIRTKLVQMAQATTIGSLQAAKQRDALAKRDIQLDYLAKWMVEQWCDVEGYDPVLHIEKHHLNRNYEEMYVSPVVF